MVRGIDKFIPKLPCDEWEILEEEFNIENNYANETLFALGNGYIGTRGNFEEDYTGTVGAGLEGTYINGFYESEVIKYAEAAYGYAEKSQTMLNVTDYKIIKLFIQDEEFNMLKGEVINYKRTLSFKEGILKRTLIWRSPKGKEIQICTRRLISFNNKYIGVINYEVTPLNFNGEITLISSLDGDVTNLISEDDPRVGSGLKGRALTIEDRKSSNGVLSIRQKTKNTKFTLVCAAQHNLETKSKCDIEDSIEDTRVNSKYTVQGQSGEKITLTKYITFVTSKEFSEERIDQIAKQNIEEAASLGYERIARSQREFLDDFWYRTDVEIKGDVALQQGIRFNIFHLLQSVGRDGRTNIAAKGLSGEGYEGHYFWDTETFILPFFLFNNPEISKKLLEYRFSILDKARERARQMSHNKGALFPWRTIGGEECSAYYPAGTAQYHINADIAFAIKRYMDATEDTDFMVKNGAEILFETARLWADLGSFIKSKGNMFCINCVTGPDEYTAIVNNNCYTNLMAKENLQYAYDMAHFMKKNYCDEYKQLCEKIELEEDEIKFWENAAQNMYIPYDEELKLHPQDDSFLDKAVWDFKNTPINKYPLLMNYHPLEIYRYQVCKQADTVLAEFLLSDKFSLEQKRSDYDFYEPITTHDSSLSTCVFSIMASEIGYQDKAYQYFMNTARMDLDDYQGNTKNGIHAANMAGTWLCVVNGFAGMRAHDSILSFSPYIPEKWESYSFKITYRGRLIKIAVSREATNYELLEGEAITILDRKVERLLTR